MRISYRYDKIITKRRRQIWNFAHCGIFWRQLQEENITRAADILRVTQPTLSRQIMDLEKELGTTLMLRGKNGLTLTDDGIFFRQRAEEIVELADRLERSFAERNVDASGLISIGASESVGKPVVCKAD